MVWSFDKEFLPFLVPAKCSHYLARSSRVGNVWGLIFGGMSLM